MECKLIEAAAFEELKAIVNRIQIRTTHLATKTMPRKPGGWLTQEEVCGMLRVSKRVLQYYRRQRKIPYSMIGNKVYFRESDIQLTEQLKSCRNFSHRSISGNLSSPAS